MTLLRSTLSIALLSLATISTSWAITESEANAGRSNLKKYADAIVGLELVVTMKGTAGDRPIPAREQKREVNGTVVSPTGLTVISLGSIDPRGSIPPAMMQNIRYDEPEFKEVKLRLADGSEIPAQVVLKDADLDLAFVAPAAGALGERQLSSVNLDDAAEAMVLANYYDISRGSKLQQRVAAVRPIVITGIIERPRRFLLVSDYSPGCPAFDANGKVLGIAVRHVAGGQQTGLVILPAEDVAEIARQAAAVKLEPAPAADEGAPAVEAVPAQPTSG